LPVAPVFSAAHFSCSNTFDFLAQSKTFNGFATDGVVATLFAVVTEVVAEDEVSGDIDCAGFSASAADLGLD
jgi:hypothetical protein